MTLFDNVTLILNETAERTLHEYLEAQERFHQADQALEHQLVERFLEVVRPMEPGASERFFDLEQELVARWKAGTLPVLLGWMHGAFQNAQAAAVNASHPLKMRNTEDHGAVLDALVEREHMFLRMCRVLRAMIDAEEQALDGDAERDAAFAAGMEQVAWLQA